MRPGSADALSEPAPLVNRQSGARMRIGIDFRILAVGPNEINRGIARFTQQQLRHVVAMDTTSEYLLLCRRGDDLSLIDPDLWSSPNVFVCHPPGWSVDPPGGDTTLLRRSAEFQDWICDQGIGLYHATTPLLFEDPYLMDFDACPMVATLYDLIPLIFLGQYLSGHPEKALYSRGVATVLRATRLLAISQSAKRDAILYLGFPKDRIDVASPVADDCFHPLGDDEGQRVLKALRDRVHLPENFVLTVTSVHHTKNTKTLLDAYGRIPHRLRVRFPLVFCCHLAEREKELVQSLADRFGCGDDLVITGQVTDAELAGLYNAATVVVHPSRYEGFGLPVLEAMSCATPVITTSSSSLPEAGGDAALLVDPDDAGGLAQAVTGLLEDPERQQAMVAAGLRHAARFSGRGLARATLDSYVRALDHPRTHDPDRVRIAMWAPLPPEQSGISDYTVELLTALVRRCDVEVFVDEGFLPDPELFRRHTIHHHRAFERRNAQVGFDMVIYQVGASFFHWYMNDAMPRFPGIVVLHDLSWSHLHYAHAAAHGEQDRFRGQLAELEGVLALRRFDATTAGPASLQKELLDDYPMLGGIVQSSKAVIVHFDGAKRELEDRYPGANVKTVMMGVADPYTGPRRRETWLARQRLGYSDNAFVLGAFGIVHPTKRLEASIMALPDILHANPATVLLIVGRALESSYRAQLEDLASSLGVASSVHFLGEVDRRTFDAALIGCDVVVNLRSSAVTHLSSTLVRGVAAAKPVVISEGSGWEFVPADARILIPVGGGEVSALATGLRKLATDTALRERMGESGRQYFEREATLSIMADRYLDIVEEVRATTRQTVVQA